MDSIERVVGGVNRHSCKPVTKRLHISGQIKISQIIRRSICLLAAFTIAQINITSVYAATDDFIDKFAANNIMFYNPEECKSDFYCCGTSLQLDWLLNNSKYEHVSPNTTDTSVLQTGDILILDGHIKLYIEIDGVGHEAQASYGDHSGQITEGVSLIDSIGRGTYQIFRFKG